MSGIYTFRKLVLLVLGICWLNTLGAAEPEKVVYKVDIKDEIGPEVWRLARKSFDLAWQEKADYILIHMNTYGGMVVYADSLRSMILNSRKPVWVFIDNNAASAGALISIACDKIYMREGANIGAATVVNQTGEAMPDKYQSYMRSMIRSTAEAQGRDTLVQGRDTVYRWKRNPHIAEAMVDQSIYIQGITDSGRVVTFTAREAMKYGFCDGMAESVEEVLKKEQVENYTIRSYHPTVTDRIIGMWLGAKLFGSRRWAFALHAEQKPEDGYVGVDLSVREEIGKQGIAVTDLRPAGKVEVGGEVYDAVSLLGDYIEKGNRVMIKKYQAGQVYVVKCEK